MEGGGVVLPRPLGEDVVVPDPQGTARELLGDGGDVRVQGQAAQRVVNETMGKDFLMSSFLAIIAHRYNMPQRLHQDQATVALGAPFTYRESLTARQQFEHQPETLDEVRERYADLKPAWEAPQELFRPA